MEHACPREREHASSQEWEHARFPERGTGPAQAPSRPGAYGLRLPALACAGGLLGDAPEHWGDWHIELAGGSGRPAEFLDGARARLVCEPSGWVDIDRAARSSKLHLPEVPTAHEIAQPRLGITAIVAAH